MFDSLYSVVNWTAIRFGIINAPGPNWLGQASYAMAAVIAVNVWRGLPFFAITVLAGLVSIPREFYEAAEVDGASSWARFCNVTLPLLKPVIAVVSVLDHLHLLRLQHRLRARRGADEHHPVFATLAYQVGINETTGPGAAISLFLFPCWPWWSFPAPPHPAG
jgi:multiple sugar transport system permease protein